MICLFYSFKRLLTDTHVRGNTTVLITLENIVVFCCLV